MTRATGCVPTVWRRSRRLRYFLAPFLAVLLAISFCGGVRAADWPYPATHVIATPFPFDILWQNLEKAITANGMGLVTVASASRGAAARGVKIPGNAVFGVYRNDFAVRMLRASVPAGIEAPLRFYLTENPDGSATLTYRVPSAVFAPYGNSDLDVMAKELDVIFASIVEMTTRE